MHESELIGLIKRRDEKGAALLLRHYAPLMRYIIAPILQNEQDREECVSEAAMRVWDKIDQFDPSRGSWNAWLTALTRNAALDKVRKNKCVVPSEDVPNEAPSSEPTPEEHIVKKEREDAVREALGRLPVQDRALFLQKILLSAVHGADSVRARHDRAGRGGQAVPPEKAAQKNAGR